MFVQSSHFIEDEGLETMKRVTFYGQEKTATGFPRHDGADE